jgi:hypothetical protein
VDRSTETLFPKVACDKTGIGSNSNAANTVRMIKDMVIKKSVIKQKLQPFCKRKEPLKETCDHTGFVPSHSSTKPMEWNKC